MNPDKMLCFSGPNLKQNEVPLEILTEKKLLVKDQFKGGYSLTQTGFAAMNDCE